MTPSKVHSSISVCAPSGCASWCVFGIGGLDAGSVGNAADAKNPSTDILTPFFATFFLLPDPEVECLLEEALIKMTLSALLGS